MEFLQKCFLYALLMLNFLLINNLIHAKTVFSNSDSSGDHVDEWAVRLLDSDSAHELAALHGLDLIGKVGSLDDVYRFKLKHERKKRMIDESDYHSFESELKNHQSVQWLERQRRLVRKKRDYVEDNLAESAVVKRDVTHRDVDPLWSQMWYLNRQLTHGLPDMNVTGAWALGYSGKGVSVTFLDDGLERDHPDLAENYDPKASFDVNEHDDDPMPRYDPTNENKHGTRCAGEVAALANNSICSVGVAFNSGVCGIRMLDGDVTDAVEASSLSFNRDHIDIYSASWGPDDNGEVVDGPGPLAKRAFTEGIEKGRNGKGSIFVWASGNGGRFGDACSCDGYVNSIHTLAISSTSESNEKPWYLEECPATLATTYSSGDEKSGDRDIITTDIRHECTTRHTGTSAAAPLAAGIIALALEANPSLTWRDVMFITVLSSRPKAIKSNVYIPNKRGFLVSSRYGFGLMDAGRMVELAKNWKNVPNMATCTVAQSSSKPNRMTQKIESILYTDGCENTGNEVKFIEQVEIVVTIQTTNRGGLEINITSPSGTRSQLLARRTRDSSSDGFKNWNFMSVQTWGESPSGTWKLEIFSREGTPAQLESFSLNIHGTKDEPVNYKSLMNPDSTFNCHQECVAEQTPCGPTEFDCSACLHFTLKIDDKRIKCVPHCPIGYFANSETKQCLRCNSNCLECFGPGANDCTNCDSKLLKLDTHECVAQCPVLGYFQNANFQCEACHPFCSECLADATFCPRCREIENSEHNVTKPIHLNNFCVSDEHHSCVSGSYMDANEKICKNCDITCLECDGLTAQDCIKCPSSRPYIQNKQCVAGCDDGFYLNETASRCFRCNSNCEQCQYNATHCLRCKEGYQYNYNGQLNTCSMIILFDEKCHETCYECYGDKKNQCRLCKQNMIIHNGACLSYPPSGFYKTTVKNSLGTEIAVFAKCDSSCKTCSDEKSCETCHDGARFLNGKCFDPCGENQFHNSTGSCVACKIPCLKCVDETTCLSCLNNKYFFNSKCYDACPLYYYNSDKTCQSCHSSCETCTGGGPNDCLTCNVGFKFNGKTCTSNCAEGTYYDVLIDECALCNQTLCEQCIEKSHKCTKCAYPLVLDLATSTCKKCCSRSIYGKIKADYSVTSCCNCPLTSEYTGFCVDPTVDSSNNTRSYNPLIILRKIYKEYNSTSVIMFSMLLFLISIVLTIWSIVTFKRSCAKTTASVEYSPLNQLLNEGDDNFYRGRHDTSLNDEEDDFELNTSDFRSFNGKIRTGNNNNSNHKINENGKRLDLETKQLIETRTEA